MPAHHTAPAVDPLEGDDPTGDESPFYRPPDSFVASFVIGGLKGGIAKTTTAIFLAFALAAAGRRPLLVDADPGSQSATTWSAAFHEFYKAPFPIMVVQFTTSTGMPGYVMDVMRDGRYTDLILDPGGHSPAQLRAALRTAGQWALQNADKQARVDLVMPVGTSWLDSSRIAPTLGMGTDEEKAIAAELDSVVAIAAELGVDIAQRIIIVRPTGKRKLALAKAAVQSIGVAVMDTVIRSLDRYQAAPKVPRSTWEYNDMLRELVEAEVTDQMIKPGKQEEPV